MAGMNNIVADESEDHIKFAEHTMELLSEFSAPSPEEEEE